MASMVVGAYCSCKARTVEGEHPIWDIYRVPEAAAASEGEHPIRDIYRVSEEVPVAT